jgi:hypothetical protein
MNPSIMEGLTKMENQKIEDSREKSQNLETEGKPAITQTREQEPIVQTRIIDTKPMNNYLALTSGLC